MMTVNGAPLTYTNNTAQLRKFKRPTQVWLYPSSFLMNFRGVILCPKERWQAKESTFSIPNFLFRTRAQPIQLQGKGFLPTNRGTAPTGTLLSTQHKDDFSQLSQLTFHQPGQFMGHQPQDGVVTTSRDNFCNAPVSQRGDKTTRVKGTTQPSGVRMMPRYDTHRGGTFIGNR